MYDHFFLYHILKEIEIETYEGHNPVDSGRNTPYA